MLIINKREFANIYSIELFDQLHIAREKIGIFEKKYSKVFESFERDEEQS